jgi:hypothetical protein
MVKPVRIYIFQRMKKELRENVAIYFRQIFYEGVDRIRLAQNCAQWLALVLVLKLKVLLPGSSLVSR